jgi:hypothetical protein
MRLPDNVLKFLEGCFYNPYQMRLLSRALAMGLMGAIAISISFSSHTEPNLKVLLTLGSSLLMGFCFAWLNDIIDKKIDYVENAAYQKRKPD